MPSHNIHEIVGFYTAELEMRLTGDRHVCRKTQDHS